LNPILINPELFIQTYLRGERVNENSNEYRIGNKGSKCILKDGSGYFDHEEGNYTSIFNEVKRREGLSTAEAIDFCKQRNLLKNFVDTSPVKNTYKEERLKYIQGKLIPFGYTIVHAYLKSRGITDNAYPDECIYHIEEPEGDLLAHRIVDINNKTIGFQTFKITPELKKIKPPKIYGSVKGGKSVISEPSLEEIVLVEGLEDGLTVYQSFLSQKIFKTVWVMIGTGNFLNVEIPKETQKIFLALDNDQAGNKVCERATERFAQMGLSVSRIRPEKEFKDFNDELRGIINEKI
tara:strand:+ start:2659 stop:3537 length:879 start_codon:yes stop_codon:yes gene_type:complete